MDLFTIARGVVSHASGIGAGVIARQAIETVAPIAVDAKKWVRALHFLGRLSIVGITIDAATQHVQKEFDKHQEGVDDIKDVVQDIKESLREASKQSGTVTNVTVNPKD